MNDFLIKNLPIAYRPCYGIDLLEKRLTFVNTPPPAPTSAPDALVREDFPGLDQPERLRAALDRSEIQGLVSTSPHAQWAVNQVLRPYFEHGNAIPLDQRPQWQASALQAISTLKDLLPTRIMPPPPPPPPITPPPPPPAATSTPGASTATPAQAEVSTLPPEAFLTTQRATNAFRTFRTNRMGELTAPQSREWFTALTGARGLDEPLDLNNDNDRDWRSYMARTFGIGTALTIVMQHTPFVERRDLAQTIRDFLQERFRNYNAIHTRSLEGSEVLRAESDTREMLRLLEDAMAPSLVSPAVPAPNLAPERLTRTTWAQERVNSFHATPPTGVTPVHTDLFQQSLRGVPGLRLPLDLSTDTDQNWDAYHARTTAVANALSVVSRYDNSVTEQRIHSFISERQTNYLALHGTPLSGTEVSQISTQIDTLRAEISKRIHAALAEKDAAERETALNMADVERAIRSEDGAAVQAIINKVIAAFQSRGRYKKDLAQGHEREQWESVMKKIAILKSAVHFRRELPAGTQMTVPIPQIAPPQPVVEHAEVLRHSIEELLETIRYTSCRTPSSPDHNPTFTVAHALLEKAVPALAPTPDPTEFANFLNLMQRIAEGDARGIFTDHKDIQYITVSGLSLRQGLDTPEFGDLDQVFAHEETIRLAGEIVMHLDQHDPSTAIPVETEKLILRFFRQLQLTSCSDMGEKVRKFIKTADDILAGLVTADQEPEPEPEPQLGLTAQEVSCDTLQFYDYPPSLAILESSSAGLALENTSDPGQQIHDPELLSKLLGRHMLEGQIAGVRQHIAALWTKKRGGADLNASTSAPEDPDVALPRLEAELADLLYRRDTEFRGVTPDTARETKAAAQAGISAEMAREEWVSNHQSYVNAITGATNADDLDTAMTHMTDLIRRLPVGERQNRPEAFYKAFDRAQRAIQEKADAGDITPPEKRWQLLRKLGEEERNCAIGDNQTRTLRYDIVSGTCDEGEADLALREISNVDDKNYRRVIQMIEGKWDGREKRELARERLYPASTLTPPAGGWPSAEAEAAATSAYNSARALHRRRITEESRLGRARETLDMTKNIDVKSMPKAGETRFNWLEPLKGRREVPLDQTRAAFLETRYRQRMSEIDARTALQLLQLEEALAGEIPTEDRQRAERSAAEQKAEVLRVSSQDQLAAEIPIAHILTTGRTLIHTLFPDDPEQQLSKELEFLSSLSGAASRDRDRKLTIDRRKSEVSLQLQRIQFDKRRAEEDRARLAKRAHP